MSNTLDQTDKAYWHRYIEFYESELNDFSGQEILEFGVWKGASIRWLMERFPHARIYGADILDPQESWPFDEHVKYFHIDQGDVSQIGLLFEKIDRKLDLVIEDGSHIPMHQRNCLIASLPHIKSGGIYILEDIQTSHPNHPLYRKSRQLFKPLVGPLHLLLALEHLKTVDPPDVQSIISGLATNSLFSLSDIRMLKEKNDSIKIFKRTLLPKRCFACGGTLFNYATLNCQCGSSLYAETDSMSALIRVK